MHLSKRLLGSSPPTWGIRKGSQKFFDLFRFIPTYVGHTNRSSGGKSPHTVHPHLRGAYTIGISRNPASVGSSPPTWGIPDRDVFVSDWARFIPTYVGHTGYGGSYPAAGTVHPHLRGAYYPISSSNGFLVGSSPPTWGILSKRCSRNCCNRFIPTYVGHTSLQTRHR